MEKEILVKSNEKHKIKNKFVKKLNKDKQSNSCNSCGICSNLRNPKISSKSLLSTLSNAKAVGKETCALSFIQKNYGNNYMQHYLNPKSNNSDNSRILQKKCSCKGACPDTELEEESERKQSLSSMEGRKLLAHEFLYVIQKKESADIQKRTERGNGFRVDDAEDCRGNWQQIGTAVSEARRMVNSAYNALQPVTRRAERIRNAMQTHFHLSQQAIDENGDFNQFRHLVTAINMFRRINNGFSGTIPFECEKTDNDYYCRNTLGYVRVIFSDIHLCPLWFGLSAREKAVTVVHEMGHKYAGLDDEAYEFEAGYRRLSTADAVDNADSYACFARDVL